MVARPALLTGSRASPVIYWEGMLEPIISDLSGSDILSRARVEHPYGWRPVSA
jgi:hypothetical protein